MTTNEKKDCGTCGYIDLRKRSFLGAVVGATVVAMWPKVAEAKKAAISLDSAEALKKINGSVVLSVKGQDVLFIRDSEKTVIAVKPVCTHKKSPLRYDKAKQVIICDEHGSTFDKKGTVLKEPATKSLSEFYRTKLDLEKNRILIIL